MPRARTTNDDDHARAAPDHRAAAGDRKRHAPLDAEQRLRVRGSSPGHEDDVRRAVEELFNVTVLQVHTQNRKGKPRRTRFRSGTHRQLEEGDRDVGQ